MRIGLAVITYNRKNYLKQCLTTLHENSWGGATERVVVDDGSSDGTQGWLIDNAPDYGNPYVKISSQNHGVAHAKNEAMRYLIEEKDCDYVFIMEDDILMLNPRTCLKYIVYARRNDIQHMNFGLHGPLNKGRGFKNYEGLWVYPDCVGAFSFYTKEVLQVVGYMDENFKNAWEHVEHTFRIAKMGYTSPFWEFVDHPDSAELLTEIPGSIDNSSIRPRDDWQKNIDEGKTYWMKKHGQWLPQRPQY